MLIHPVERFVRRKECSDEDSVLNKKCAPSLPRTEHPYEDEFLHSLHLCRAIAIVLIVAGHSYWLAGLKVDTFAERWVANLIFGETAMFVFISGFLFHHIFLPKFDYLRFMKGKTKTILIPYLLLSCLAISLLLLVRPEIRDNLVSSKDAILWKVYLFFYLQQLSTGTFLF